MPIAPRRPCNCGALTAQPPCQACRCKRELKRGTAAQRGYDARWRKARAEHLQANPWCVDHAARGQYVPATDVDHDEPHSGDQAKFWDRSKWRSRCHSCHSRKTATRDGGFGNEPSRFGGCRPGGRGPKSLPAIAPKPRARQFFSSTKFKF